MALEFQRDIIKTLVEEDALIVMSKGLGLHKLIFNFLKLHCSSKRLVFVLNVSPTEQQLFIEELTESGVALKDLPRRINAEYTMNERITAYGDGGVHFANSTSLVMDFLYKRVPLDKVDGFLVLHAEKVTETSAEAFILRMFRKSSKEGFIKGFSEFPEAFLSGFAKSEKIMKNLFVKKIHLWPRFRDRVQESLEKHTPNVVELSQDMTPAMKEIQSAVVEILKACIDEIKRTNMVDVGELKEEDVFQEWDQILRGQLDPVWHKIGFQTKQLINDIASLRKLLTYLVRYDCVTFYQYLESLKMREVAQHSMWFYMEAADKLFRIAKNRVYITKRPAPPTKKTKAAKSKKKKQESSSESENEEDKEQEEEKKEPPKPPETQYITVLEENPKWSLLTEVLSEIEAEEAAQTTGEPGKILVMVRDDKTCTQLQEYLEMGAGMLKKTFLRFIEAKEKQAERATAPKAPEPPKTSSSRGSRGRGWQKRGRGGRGGSSTRGGKGGKTAPSVGSLVDLQIIKKSLDMKEVTSPSKKPPLVESLLSDIFTVKDFETYFGVLPAPHIVVHSLSHKKRVLTDLRPKYVVLYDTDVGFFRQLEVYKAENPGVPLRVYFLTYSESIEQFKYLNTLKREMDAFEHLIREKSIMAVPQEQDGKTVIDIARPEDTMPGNTRKGGKQEKIVRKNKIIVDSREFRSALPAILYQRDFEIVPATLEVGDYILTPEVAIERKSLSDLYQSFNSGRLFNQATALCKHFKKPILLIEFDEDQPFSFLEETTDEITDNNIHTKLVLLVKSFPTLKIIWARSPYVTIDYFEELKRNQDDPDTSTVNVLTSGEDDETSEQAINILKTMPGITSFNYTKITNNVKNLQELSNMSLEQLTTLLGANSAQQLYDFFNDSPPLLQSE